MLLLNKEEPGKFRNLLQLQNLINTLNKVRKKIIFFTHGTD